MAESITKMSQADTAYQAALGAIGDDRSRHAHGLSVMGSPCAGVS